LFDHAIDAPVLASEQNSVQGFNDADIVLGPAEGHMDDVPHVESPILMPSPNIAPDEESEISRHPAMDEPPSSSSSESDTVGGPYWKDFDRIQSRTFHERARQLQYRPTPAVITASTSDEMGTWTSEDTQPMEGAMQEQTSWFSSLRRSVSRRRRVT
jgi:hypothetical protein